MNRKMILNYLNAYNEHEQFYMNYHEAAKSPDTLKAFLDSVDKDYVLSEHILVFDLFPDQVPQEWSDDFFFDKNDSKSILVRKHYRYTPAFNHQNVFFEMKYVLRGNCSMTIGNDSINLSKGDLCMLSPGTMHSVSVFDDSLVINILIRHGTLEDILFNVLRDQSIISAFFLDNIYAKKHLEYMIFHTCDDCDIRDLVLDMYVEEIRKDLYSSSILNSMLIILFAQLTRNHRKTVEFSPTVKKLPQGNTNLLSYIQNHYQEVTLSDVAREFSYDPAYCSRLIKSITGQSFSDLLRDIRLKRAEIMLQSTNIPISQISRNIGYENPEAFIRAFRKRTDMTPSQYRNKGNGENQKPAHAGY